MKGSLASLVVALVGSVLWAGETDRVEWRTDYDAARKESTEKNRPIFIQVTTDDCVHCRRLEAGPFRDGAIMGLLNERFIPLKLDAKLAPKLVQALRVQVYPTMVVAATDGKIIGFIEGFHDVKPLAENMGKCLALTQPDPHAKAFEEAAKAVNANDFAKAITLLKSITADGKEQPLQVKAKQALKEIDQHAASKLVEIKQQHDKGQTTEATTALNDFIARFAGSAVTSDASKWLATLTEARPQDANRRVRDLLTLAQEANKAERYHEALDVCEILETTYKDTPEAKQASLLASEIRSNPEKLAKACDNLNDRLAFMYATLAEGYLKKGERELAALNFEKAVRAAPASVIARDAQAKLAALSVKTNAVPTRLQKKD